MGPYWVNTFNPVVGCTPCSPGCANCWARQMHERFHAEPFSNVRTLPEVLSKPLRRRKPTTFFVCNTSDLFHPSVPFEFVAQVWAAMILAHQHTFLVCTKRPDRMREALTDPAFYNAVLDAADVYRRDRPGLLSVGISDPARVPTKNVWLGVTAENQAAADERIPTLLATPAAHRWVSAEPLLGPVDFGKWMFDEQEYAPHGSTFAALPLNPSRALDQIIVGAESSPGHRLGRPLDLAWVRSLRDQCAEPGVPFMYKQGPVDGKLVELPELDGKVWDQIPGGA